MMHEHGGTTTSLHNPISATFSLYLWCRSLRCLRQFLLLLRPLQLLEGEATPNETLQHHDSFLLTEVPQLVGHIVLHEDLVPTQDEVCRAAVRFDNRLTQRLGVGGGNTRWRGELVPGGSREKWLEANRCDCREPARYSNGNQRRYIGNCQLHQAALWWWW